jgi:hypothetical protein
LGREAKKEARAMAKASELHEALMGRDGLGFEEADELVSEMRERVLGGEDPEEVLHEEGLEPDYVFDLL